MPLSPPNLDDRTFDDLVRDARLRAARYLPEWTDYNLSDPGATLIDLFAWLTEMILFRLNQVPDSAYLKLLQLLDIELRPAKPAKVNLTFNVDVKDPNVTAITIPRFSRFEATPADGGDALVFETERDIDLLPLNLQAVQSFDGTAFEDVTVLNAADAPASNKFNPFGPNAPVGSALYLGFGSSIPAERPRRFPPAVSLHVFMPHDPQRASTTGERVGPSEQRITSIGQGNVPPVVSEVYELLKYQDPTSPQFSDQARSLVNRLAALVGDPAGGSFEPVPRPRLQWEYYAAPAGTWRGLEAVDSTKELRQDGYIQLVGFNDEVHPSVQGRVRETELYWVRCRLVQGVYPNKPPAVRLIRPNTVPALNLSSDFDLVLGSSDGTPKQAFLIRQTPVHAESLELEVITENNVVERWTQTDDLAAHGPNDKAYALDDNSGQVRFGDGEHGQIPAAGQTILARRYRYGGGARGNLPAGSEWAALQNVTGVDSVENLAPASGGADEQTVEQLKTDAPTVLRQRNRAVTPDDFETLARQAGGVDRAMTVPLAHPDYPGVPVPGSVTVVIVPASDARPPVPDRELLRAVADEIDEHRLVTTEVHVRGPRYLEVRVQATITAAPGVSFGRVRDHVKQALDRHLSPRPWRPREGAPAPGAAPETAPRFPGGWPFGRDLYTTELYSVILAVPDVRGVVSLSVFVNGRLHDDSTVSEKRIRVAPDALVFSARPDLHDIVVQADVDLQ